MPAFFPHQRGPQSIEEHLRTWETPADAQENIPDLPFHQVEKKTFRDKENRRLSSRDVLQPGEIKRGFLQKMVPRRFRKKVRRNSMTSGRSRSYHCALPLSNLAILVSNPAARLTTVARGCAARNFLTSPSMSFVRMAMPRGVIQAFWKLVKSHSSCSRICTAFGSRRRASGF